MPKMLFGTAGVPLQCAGSSIDGVACVKQLGLDAFELEFVHGCRLSIEKAGLIGILAKKLGVSLSCHASFYLNLLSQETHKLANTRREVLRTAEVMGAVGGGRLVFHAGFYLKRDRPEAYSEIKKQLEDLIPAMPEGVFLAPEITGKFSAFGNMAELYGLAEELGYDKIRPTIDWAHLHARGAGFKTEDDYRRVLDFVEEKVGKIGLQTLHCHMSSIEFTEKGERRHLPMTEDTPPFKPLAQALLSYGCGGTIISESPRIEEDALMMQGVYSGLS